MQWTAQEYAGFTAGIPWESVNEEYTGKNVAVQSENPTSLLSCYRELIRLRATHPVLQVGDYRSVGSNNNAILAFLRSEGDNNMLVIINLGEAATSDYNLTLKEGTIIGTYQALTIYGGDATLKELTANAKGGFDSYQPLPEMLGASVLVIELIPIR